MSVVELALILACVALETVEQAFFRRGSDRPSGGRPGARRRWIAVGMALNVLGMAVWLVVLRTVPLGQAMPLLAANNVTVALAGKWLFGERISARRWLGIWLITSGVALVGSEAS